MITSLFTKITVALALVGAMGAMGAASAAPVFSSTVNMAPLDRTLIHTHEVTGAFDDVLSFKATTLLGAVASLTFIDWVGDLNGSYIFGVGNSYDTVSWDKSTLKYFSGTGDILTEYVQSFPTLQSGKTYWIEIAGSMTDGSYTAMVIPSEIPEPGSMALVLAGVGAAAFVSRRRKNSVTRMGA